MLEFHPVSPREAPALAAFAPHGREGEARIAEQHALILAQPMMREILDGVPSLVVVLNDKRQIVFANEAFRRFLGVPSEEDLTGAPGHYVESYLVDGLLGRRPGEALGCIRAGLTPEGCGSTTFCRTCGAARVIDGARWTARDLITETRIVRQAPHEPPGTHENLELSVWTRTIDVEHDRFVVLCLSDASAGARRG